MSDFEPPFLQMNCDIDDVRLLHDSVAFYLENYPNKDPDKLQANIKHLKHFKKTLYSMLLEYNFHKDK
tara:strand:+ start:2458 stop:2661 length:204 start_codon:yes stop_codon:yes gene_type:complete